MTSEGDEIGHEADEDDGILRHASAYHAPVLWHTVVRDLITDREGVYVDGTLGGGGHTAALLAALSRGGRVIGIDRDAAAIKEAGQRLSDEEAAGRLTLVHGRFGDVSAHLDTLGIKQVDGLLLDLGISSHQVDLPERGFSYMAEGALDMRMNQAAGPSASDVVNEWPERDLAQLFFEFGEEPGSRRIARAIVAARPLSTTRELADVVRSVVPGREEVKTLSRVFQALRIVVNQELAELEQALEGAATRIRVGGRVVVISYHSLEDRRVKRFFRSGNFEGRLQRDVYGNPLVGWKELHRKPIEAGEEEKRRNPRSRSARLRAAERVEAPGTVAI